MVTKKEAPVPDQTAVRVALWRAMHVQLDARGYRASIVGRARVIEDLVQEQVNNGVEQYVILAASNDTFRTANLSNLTLGKPGR